MADLRRCQVDGCGTVRPADRLAATQRMNRRWATIRAARDQFEALPESTQEILRIGLQRAQDEAQAVLHYGRGEASRG